MIRLTFFTLALSLILSLFCLPTARTTFASRNLHYAHRSMGHSPAYKKGMNALSNSDYETAAEHFKQAAADKPDDMWAFYYLGLCLLRLKRFDEAANATKEALTLKSTEAAVRYQLAIIYPAIGDQEAAEKEYRWLQEYDKELALYLSDPLPSNKTSAQQTPNASASSANDKAPYEPATMELKPTILYRESAKYTKIARTNRVQGIVVLQVVFAVNGEIQIIRVIRALPDGLTHKAIEAARKIRFIPAKRDGAPISVRGQLEFVFRLY
jgi:TonB family protein